MDQALKKEPTKPTSYLADPTNYIPKYGDYCIIGSPIVYNTSQNPPPEYRKIAEQIIVPPQ